MSPAEFLFIIATGLIGLVCVCILIVAVGAWIIGEHRDEARFRQELREAHRLEAQRQVDDYLIDCHAGRTHSRSRALLPARRGDR